MPLNFWNSRRADFVAWPNTPSAPPRTTSPGALECTLEFGDPRAAGTDREPDVRVAGRARRGSGGRRGAPGERRRSGAAAETELVDRRLVDGSVGRDPDSRLIRGERRPGGVTEHPSAPPRTVTPAAMSAFCTSVTAAPRAPTFSPRYGLFAGVDELPPDPSPSNAAPLGQHTCLGDAVGPLERLQGAGRGRAETPSAPPRTTRPVPWSAT